MSNFIIAISIFAVSATVYLHKQPSFASMSRHYHSENSLCALCENLSRVPYFFILHIEFLDDFNQYVSKQIFELNYVISRRKIAKISARKSEFSYSSNSLENYSRRLLQVHKAGNENCSFVEKLLQHTLKSKNLYISPVQYLSKHRKMIYHHQH